MTTSPTACAAALAILAFSGCDPDKSPTRPNPDPVVIDPSGINRLQSKSAFPGWYRQIERASSGNLHARTYHLFSADGAYHKLGTVHRLDSPRDSVLLSVDWGRGVWLRMEAIRDSADGPVPWLCLAQYQAGYLSQESGLPDAWQARVSLEEVSSWRNHAVGFRYDTLLLSDPAGGSRLTLVREADAPLPFNAAAGPAIPGGRYDQDGDAIADFADPDIDGDAVPNPEDCSPFDSHYLVAQPGGGCGSLDEPYNVKAASGDGAVTLQWASPSPGGFEVVYASVPEALLPGGKVTGSGEGAVITGLKNGATYSFVVRRTYGAARSAPSRSVECVPLAAPTDPRAESLRDTLKLDWKGEGVAVYRILYSPGDTLDTLKAGILDVGKPPYPLIGLAEGRYTFAVRSVADGWASALSRSATGEFRSGMRELAGPWASTLMGGCALALQDDSLPVVLYSDTTQQNTLAVSAWRGGKWEPQGAPGIRKPSRNAVLRIASDGTPHVLFKNDVSSKLELQRLRNGAWESAGLQEFLDNADWGFARYDSYDMAIAKDGTIYAAFQDPERAMHLTVLRSTAAGWEAVERRGFSAGAASSPRIVIRNDGAPYVAYIDAENGYFPVIKTLTDGHWESVGNTGIKAMNGLSLALLPDGQPAIAFITGDFFAGAVSVMRFDGAAWSFAGKQAMFAARETALAAGPGGALFLALDTRYLYRFSGAEWLSVGPERLLPAGSAAKIGLAVARSGVPYVIHNQSNGNKTRVALRSFEY